MIGHLQDLEKGLRLRLWCAARRGDWATIDATAERWALVCDRVAEIGFLITHLVALASDDRLCQTLVAAAHLARRPRSSQAMKQLEEMATARAHGQSSLLATINFEAALMRWNMSGIAVKRQSDAFETSFGYELHALANSALKMSYAIIYPTDRALAERMIDRLQTVAAAIDRKTISATSTNTAAAGFEREMIMASRSLDPRHVMTCLTMPAINQIGRTTVNMRHRWLLLPIAHRLLDASGTGVATDLQSTNTASDRLVDPASPTDEFFRLEQHGEAWLLRGRGFDGRLGEHIDPGERLSDDAGIWLYPALLPPPTTEEGP